MLARPGGNVELALPENPAYLAGAGPNGSQILGSFDGGEALEKIIAILYFPEDQTAISLPASLFGDDHFRSLQWCPDPPRLFALGENKIVIVPGEQVLSYPRVPVQVGEGKPSHRSATLPRRVRHARFGEGVVVGSEGVGDSLRLTIEFDSGTKKVLAQYVETMDD